MPENVNIMIVDDSFIIRKILEKILKEQKEFNIIAQARDGNDVLRILDNSEIAESVDVIILDLEMPGMDGMTALPQIIKKAPHVRVIIASTLSQKNAQVSLEALEKGAADYLPKPSSAEASNTDTLNNFSAELVLKVKSLGLAAQRLKLRKNTGVAQKTPSQTPAAIEDYSLHEPIRRPKAIAIGSSTGGPDALKEVLGNLNMTRLLNIPMFITQHMPAHFTKLLATNLSTKLNINLLEAKDGDIVKGGNIYLAPGDFHMEIMNIDNALKISLNQNPPENFCRPAVDVMLRSLAENYGRDLLTVILTGMGSDGAKGCEKVRENHGQIIAQDKETSTVWGMPAAAAKTRLCSQILPLNQIAPKIMGAIL
ncbi:MAG: chemotaxis response regulator protein-glutamate methylesterase [Alphaproteobacteria bacterium CG11_big_fil_rev_8_21_14_0_20_44_7]|nr:MAG: chemotaxis response regulator protein-glutamate methylesterase [Alphaproteobacteria bacterium CG11_big_fil_rev_8_21_14_0_20_44_7]